MEIKDDGKACAEQRVQRVTKGGVGAGVAFAGMRERVARSGGRSLFCTGSTGTRVHQLLRHIPLTGRDDESSEFAKTGSSSPGAFVPWR